MEDCVTTAIVLSLFKMILHKVITREALRDTVHNLSLIILKGDQYMTLI